MGFIRLGNLARRHSTDTVELSAAAANRSNPGAASDSERERPEKKKKSKDVGLGAHHASDASTAASLTPTGSAVGSRSSRSPSAAAAPGGSSGRRGLSVNDFISKTKNQQRQGLKPSGPELVAYARYLGIDPVADHDLLWIAVEALEAPLPCDWTEHFDSNDRVFYYNSTMRVSSWTHPLEHIYRETYKNIVNFRNANMASHDREDKIVSMEAEVGQMYAGVRKEISQWAEHVDKHGHRFYFNREERRSTWEDPRPAKCSILFLKMKMLRVLQAGSGRAQTGIGDPASYEQLIRHTPGARSAAVAASSVNATIADGTQTAARDEDRARSPKSQESKHESDSDTDEDARSRKKKKKKKKRREHSPAPDEGRYQAVAAPPSRHGPQDIGSTRSESSVSAKPMANGTADEVRGRRGAMPHSPTRDQAVTLGNFDSHEGLSNVGRAKFKAGIRLDPIAAAPAGNQAAGNQGVRNSASAPLLP